MPEKLKLPKNTKRRSRRLSDSPKGEKVKTTSVGDISGGKGFAIGENARSIFIEIKSLFDLSTLINIIKQNWLFLIISLGLQGFAIALWQRYADRFLIPAGVLFAGMLLLQIGLLSTSLLMRGSKRPWILSLSIFTSLVGLTGLAGLQYERIVHPPQFDLADFGVAIAQFAEGPDYQNTPRAREISQVVLERLRQQAEENPDLRFVHFTPIGLVRTEAEALEEGQKIRADLVIWGRLQISDAATTLNFTIIETPDKISNPTYPRVVPFIEPSAKGTLQIPGNTSEEIANGTTTIAAFTFGLAHHSDWDFVPAARAFKQALATSPSESETYRYLIHLYYGLSLLNPGELEAASEQFKLATALRPDDPAALLAMAFVNRSLGNIDQAKRDADEASRLITQYLKLHPENAMAFYNRALAQEVLEDWRSALRDYQVAIDKETSLYIARIGAIRMNLVLNQPAEAIQTAQEAVELAELNGANPAWAYLYLAQSYENNHDLAEAQLAFQKARTLGRQVDWVHLQAGQFYTRIGDLESAEEEYKLMIDVSSNRAGAHATLANFYAANNRLDQAVAEYQAALHLDPAVDRVWVELADVYARQGHFEDAENAYIRAIGVANRSSDLFYDRFSYGYFLSSQGRWHEAIAQWEAAYEIEPANCQLMLNMGRAYENVGNTDRTRQIYLQILALDAKAGPDCIQEAQERLNRLAPP